MELTEIKKVKAENARIVIHIDPDTQATSMWLSYRCPACAGHGCRYSGNTECKNGEAVKKLDPEHLDQVFDGRQLMKIKAAVQNLYLTVIGD